MRTVLAPVLMLLSLILSGCDSGGGTVEEGIQVRFLATAHQSPDASASVPQTPSGPKTFTTTEGVQITLHRAYLVLWSSTLESDCTAPDFVHVPPTWFDWFVAPAYAHADPAPTRLSIPFVINLLNQDLAEVDLGEIGPPPGTYCGATVEVLKADADTQDLPQNVNMIGRALYLEAEYVPTTGARPESIVVDTGKSLVPARRRLLLPLTLDESNRNGRVVIGIRYDRWFDGIDLAQLDDPVQLDQLLANVIDSIHL